MLALAATETLITMDVLLLVLVLRLALPRAQHDDSDVLIPPGSSNGRDGK